MTQTKLIIWHMTIMPLLLPQMHGTSLNLQLRQVLRIIFFYYPSSFAMSTITIVAFSILAYSFPCTLKPQLPTQVAELTTLSLLVAFPSLRYLSTSLWGSLHCPNKGLGLDPLSQTQPLGKTKLWQMLCLSDVSFQPYLLCPHKLINHAIPQVSF